MENKLKYSSPATCFNEALVLGCGALGATVYADPIHDRISFNHDTLWSGSPRRHKREGAREAYISAKDAALSGDLKRAQKTLEEGFNAQYSQAYLPLCNLYIESQGDEESTDYTRTLDLEKAILSASYDKCGRVKREYFVSAPDSCFAMRITSENPSNYVLYADSLLKHTVSAADSVISLSGECPSDIYGKGRAPAGHDEIEYLGGSITFTAAFFAETDGKIYENAGRLFVSASRSITVFMYTDTSFVSYKEPPTREHRERVLYTLSWVAKKGYDAIRAEHIKDFSSYYNRVRLDLGAPPSEKDTDERLKHSEGDIGLYELLFNFGRYLMISSSRPGSQATNLQGIWNESLVPPWLSNYTVNINTEMNYWPTLMCNLTEFTEPLVRLIKMLSDTGRDTAAHYYGAEGFTSHHNTDIWGLSNPVGINVGGSAVYAFWPLSAGWLCRHLMEIYEYTCDTEFLSGTAYPLMREAARFFLSVMVKDEDGKYILCPSTSPENSFISGGERIAVAKWTTMSQSIIGNLLKDCLRCADILGISDDFTADASEKLQALRGIELASDGCIKEWDREYTEADIHHRHVSHLYALYPGDLITTESTPELAEACRRSLEKRGDASTGWSLGWKVNLWAKLKDGDRALNLVDMQLKPVPPDINSTSFGGGTYPNMLDAHPPFQIDGNFGVTAGIAQMLLQCEDGIIRILPALPRSLSSGSVRGLLAKGGITVGIDWKNGRPTRLILLSKRRQYITLSICRDEHTVSILLPEGEETEFR